MGGYARRIHSHPTIFRMSPAAAFLAGLLAADSIFAIGQPVTILDGFALLSWFVGARFPGRRIRW